MSTKHKLGISGDRPSLLLGALVVTSCFMSEVASHRLGHSIVDREQDHRKRRSRLGLSGLEVSELDEVFPPDPSDTVTNIRTYNGNFGPAQPVTLNFPVTDEDPVGDNLGGEVFKLNIVGDGTYTYEKLADNGFGKPTNKYIWSSAINPISGDLCVGTLNLNWDVNREPSYLGQVLTSPDVVTAWLDAFGRIFSGSPIAPTEGGEVWCKENDQSSWTLVYELPSEHTGLRNMIFYDGQYYGASANGPNGPEPDQPYIVRDLYSIDGGPGLFRGDVQAGTWEQVNDRGHINGYDRSFRAMVVSSYSDKLFIGTETNIDVLTTARVLSYDAKDDTWENIFLGYLVGAVTQAIELEPGLLLFGCTGVDPGSGEVTFGGIRMFLLNEQQLLFNEESFSQVVDVTDSLNAKVEEDLPIQLPINVILEFTVFNDHLFVGVLGFDAFKFYKTASPSDPNSWDFQRVSTDGFQQEQIDQLGSRIAANLYTWSSAVIGDTYYIGTLGDSNPSAEEGDDAKSADGRAQLWSSKDGVDWKIIVSDSFGEAWTNGFRTMQACPDGSCLYIGTSSSLYIPVFSRAPYGPNYEGPTESLVTEVTIGPGISRRRRE